MTMQLRQTITRTVEGHRFTVDHGTIALIAARREYARPLKGMPHVRVLTDLRNEVAERLGTDRRTAHYILAAIKYGQLFV